MMNIFFKCAHWPKMSNVCRVNRVPMNMLCPRGQQIRVFGGFYKHAMDDGYIVYRPHYHPILDESIVEDTDLWKEQEDKAAKRFENKSDVNALMDYWTKKLGVSGLKPTLSVISVGDDGQQEEKVEFLHPLYRTVLTLSCISCNQTANP